MSSSPLILRKRCFDPVVDAHTRLLVLGSLPGEQSLARNEYYGNSRLAALLAHRVGLWDVVAEAQREGSLDSRIRERDDNDLLGLIATLPELKVIAFNGGTAARLGMKVLGFRKCDYQIVALPSSSPAYTLPYAEKAICWHSLRPMLFGA
jgi:G:T/U-mismatch repair DNA glycosylase